VSGGSFATAHTLVLSEGQVLTVRNRDECGILLEQTAGPVRALAVGKVAEPLGKPVVVPLHTPGVYEFTGTDYEAADLVAEPGTEWGLSRVASTGADNVLTLRVRVLPSRAPAE
jgi:hypothetical protein